MKPAVIKAAFVLAGIFYLLLMDAFDGASVGENAGSQLRQLQVFVSIAPQRFFVEKVGGNRVSVTVLVETGKDPHIYEPTPKQVVNLGSADLYFAIGFPFEERILKKVEGTKQRVRIVRTDKGIARRAADTDSEYGGGMEDPHIWLSPPLIKIQSLNIFEALADADPGSKKLYRSNIDAFLRELDALNAKFTKMFEPFKGRSFFVFHPSLGYFAEAYGLQEIAVETEGKSPTPREIERLIDVARARNVKIIFISPQFDKKSVEVIAGAIGGSVGIVDPLANDVLKNLEDIAYKIRDSFTMR